MSFYDLISGIWQIISRNKIRSFLTMLGIIIGIMAVIIVLSVGAGAQSLILNQVKSMGSNLIGILPGKSNEKGPPASVMGVTITTLTHKDIEAILSEIPELIAGNSYVKGVDTIVHNEQQITTNFVGVNYSYINVEDTKVELGRFFTQEEEKTNAKVAVLGSEVYDNLFFGQNPIGQQIKIKKNTFTIIGVMKKRGVSGMQNQDNQIFVPLPTAQKFLLGINYINFARLKVNKAENVDRVLEEVKMILRERHEIDNPENDDFSVRSMAQGLEAITKITNALTFFLVSVAAIALLVGGIGIMNIMLAAVQERVREIGLRKAVGAKNKDIILQFLLETIIITFFGGAVGIILGVFFSYIIAKTAQYLGYDWEFIISPISVLLGCLISIIVGLIFGLLPANRASKLDPIEALRYE